MLKPRFGTGRGSCHLLPPLEKGRAGGRQAALGAAAGAGDSARLSFLLLLCLAAILLTGCPRFSDGPDVPDEFLMAIDPPVYTEELAADAVQQAVRLIPAAGFAGWQDLAPALERSLVYAAARPADAVAVAHGDETVLWSDVRRTLERLQELLPRLDHEPGLLGEQFRWLRLTQGADFSGYYEPLLNASPRRTDRYRYPLYAAPSDLLTLNLGAFENRLIGQRVQYRIAGGKAVPYYTRAEIEAGALRGRGLELAWLQSPVDAYLLQVQGSGRLRFGNGKEQPVLFAATNGRPYTGIGRVLHDRGDLAGPLSQDSLRAWLEAHPEQAAELMALNERYVFFRFHDEGPIGGLGQLLTPWVSVAADPNLLPLGSAVVFSVEAPFMDGPRLLHSLGLTQDTGAAIKGRRIDLFCGNGEAAAYTAGHLNASGAAWLLIAR